MADASTDARANFRVDKLIGDRPAQPRAERGAFAIRAPGDGLHGRTNSGVENFPLEPARTTAGVDNVGISFFVEARYGSHRGRAHFNKSLRGCFGLLKVCDRNAAEEV